MEPLDYSSVCGTIYDLSDFGSEEDFGDDYFSQPDAPKISHLHLKDLETKEPKGASSLHATVNTPTLPTGIFFIYLLPSLYSRTLTIADLFIHDSGRWN